MAAELDERKVTFKQHIYLSGYRGTGKSSVGRILAQRLDRPFVDLDDEVEQRAGRSIREIFDGGGEEAFRDLETRCLTEVAQEDVASVISLGGGAILRDQNREQIRATGICIWLDADAQTLAERINADQSTGQRRPALTKLSHLEEIQSMLSVRKPLYQSTSDHRIDTKGKSVNSVAEQALKLLGLGDH